MDIDYVGEHSLLQLLGKLAVFISFTAAIASSVSYLKSNKDASWISLARGFYRIHSFAVLSIVALMFIMLFNGWYEFSYVWEHRNNEMPLRYILSCFWEGQEGSFLLWTFWNVVLGNLLIRSAKNWEAPVMTTFSVIQIFLTSMLLGIYILDYKMGSNPFVLIRELPENLGLPWTFAENYLERFPQFQDGRGLNPLLQNYWMVIHPPIVMLGFALTAVPFSFAIAGLQRNKLSEWIKPALPWAYAGIMILGCGVLMGGAWAYEALSFGGFWAWDPVENASLVPWLLLVGGAHVMIVNQRDPKSLFSAFILVLSSFILIVYSTFLTRSGVLGDSSVHSFTGNGMIEQLMVFLVFFIALAIGYMIRNETWRKVYLGLSVLLLIGGFVMDSVIFNMLIFVVLTFVVLISSYIKFFPKAKEEENFWSREFWLFVGAMVLAMSAIQIISKTSLPVFNYLSGPLGGVFNWLAEFFNSDDLRKLSEGSLAIESQDAVKAAYNKYQIPFAMFITLFMAFIQYLRYKETPFKEFGKKLILPLAITTIIFIALLFAYDWGQYFSSEWSNFRTNFFGLSMILLLFTSIFTIVGNLNYFLRMLKGKVDHAGASIAHIGFGMVIFGSLISTGQSEKISMNVSGQDVRSLNDGFKNSEDIFMFQRDTLLMGDYFVSYESKQKEGINFLYNVDYYATLPKTYSTGEVIFNAKANQFFQAKQEHVASENFLYGFEENWEPVHDLDHIENGSVKRWAPYEIGNKKFTLSPRIQMNEKFGNVPEPDTKHFLVKDIYTHIRYGDLALKEVDSLGYQTSVSHEVSLGDTIKLSRAFLTVDSLIAFKELESLGITDTSAIALKALISINLADTSYKATPILAFSDAGVQSISDEIENLGIRIGFDELNLETGKLAISTSLHDSVNPDFIVMQAIVFPMINILWIGSILMVLGTFMAIRFRLRRQKSLENAKT